MGTLRPGLLWGSQEIKDRRVLCSVKSFHAQVLSGLAYLQKVYAFHWLSMSASLSASGLIPDGRSSQNGWMAVLLTDYPTTVHLLLLCSLDWPKPITVILLPLSVIGWNMDMWHNSDQWTWWEVYWGLWKTSCSYQVNAFDNVDVLMPGAAAAISELERQSLRTKCHHWDFESLNVFDPLELPSLELSW